MNELLPPELLTGLHAIGHAVHPLVALLGISNPLQPLVDLLRGLLEWLESWSGSWGLAIIMLTVIVRIVIFPLTWKQIRSQLAMQSLQPKIKELQRKHKGDKAKLQEETMKLYREYRINPLASCFPLILQLPIFICLYWAIRGETALANSHFLWFTLGRPDPIGFSIGPVSISILMVIYIASQLASTELMMMPETPTQQKWIMRAMPFMFVLFLSNFPSGLFVYWITTNLWTVAQAGIIRYMRAKHPMELTPEKVAKRRESRFMQAMHAAQEQRQSGEGGGQAGRPVPRGGKPAPKSGGQRPAQRQGKPAARPDGKPGARPDGKPGARPSGKPGGKPAGKPGARPAPAGQRPQGSPAQASGKPGARPAGPRPAPNAKSAPSAPVAQQPKPVTDGQGKQDGPQGGATPKSRSSAIGNRPASKSASGKRPSKPSRKRPSGGGS